MKPELNETTLSGNLRNYRIAIDQLIRTRGSLLSSREIAIVYTSFEDAKLWLGKCLGELEEPTPYPEADNPKSPLIEPEADTAEDFIISFNDEKTHLARVKKLRSYLEVWIGMGRLLKPSFEPDVLQNEEFIDFYKASIMSLIRAKMWLGKELGRIRDIQNAENKETLHSPGPKIDLY